MNRAHLRTTLFALACTLVAAGAGAQQPPDISQVKIVTTKLTDSVYALDGQGGRMAFLIGSDGIFVVDSQFAPLSDRLIAAIKEVSPLPLRWLVNTHVHPDHTGGNENFAKLGVMIMARPRLRERLMRPGAAAPGAPPSPPAPAGALPMFVFDNRTVLYVDGEAVQLIPLPAAHTDTDTGVYFPRANVLMTGDVFRSTGYPNIDRGNGGSLVGMLNSLETLITTANDTTRVVPGHGDITTRPALLAHYQMISTVRDRVDAMMVAGKTMAAIIASKPTKDFDAKFGANADRFVQQVFEELAAR